MPKIRVIQATKGALADKMPVAAYCRVSSDSEDQRNSFAAQVKEYTRQIESNEQWALAGIYADKGISGTSAHKRPEFLRLIEDCKQGKVKRILTKSISRFARNTVECLEYVRELKARVDLLIRRRRQLAQASSDLVLTIGNLSIDRVAHKAFYREQDLCLANREYEVLLYLAEHPDRDITFEELGTALFGVYRESDRRSVMVNVSRLRKRFEGNYELENRIETVWSKGYRFLKGGI